MTLDHDAYSLHAEALRAMTAQLKAQRAMLRDVVIPSVVSMRVQRPERPALQHEWTSIAVGRVCTICRTSQAEDEFDDAIACRGR
jgi:hypothetical protein